jgi:hypothetical protein
MLECKENETTEEEICEEAYDYMNEEPLEDDESDEDNDIEYCD